jgi:hypothetical protein
MIEKCTTCSLITGLLEEIDPFIDTDCNKVVPPILVGQSMENIRAFITLFQL